MATQRNINAYSAATAEGRPLEERQHFYKTELCKFHMKQRCLRGGDCVYAHSPSELQPKPNFYKTRLCIKFMTYGCCEHGDLCSYAHQDKELRLKTLEQLAWTSCQVNEISSLEKFKHRATPLSGERNSKPTDEASLATPASMLQSAAMSMYCSGSSPERTFILCDDGKDKWDCQPNTSTKGTEDNNQRDEDADDEWKVLGFAIVQNTFLEWKPMNWAESSDAARRSRSVDGRIEYPN